MQVSLLDILSIIVVFQLLFIAFFVFTHTKGKKISNVLLGSFFLSLGLNLGDGMLISSGAYQNFLQLAFIGNNFGFVFGPLLYFYTRSVIYKDYRLQKNCAAFIAISAGAGKFYPFLSPAVCRTSKIHSRIPAAEHISGLLELQQFTGGILGS
jgi:hypothetical protein